MKRSCFFLARCELLHPRFNAVLNGSVAGSSEIDLTQWTPPDIQVVPLSAGAINLRIGPYYLRVIEPAIQIS